MQLAPSHYLSVGRSAGGTNDSVSGALQTEGERDLVKQIKSGSKLGTLTGKDNGQLPSFVISAPASYCSFPGERKPKTDPFLSRGQVYLLIPSGKL